MNDCLGQYLLRWRVRTVLPHVPQADAQMRLMGPLGRGQRAIDQTAGDTLGIGQREVSETPTEFNRVRNICMMGRAIRAY